MKALPVFLACLALAADATRAQGGTPATKPVAAVAGHGLKLTLFTLDANDTQVPAKSARLHLSGAHLGGDGNYMTTAFGELKLTLSPGPYMLDVLSPASCAFAVTIKPGQDLEVALVVPKKDGGTCAVAKNSTKGPAKAAAKEPPQPPASAAAL